MAHGRLRIYLGAAPGVGKTYAMLAEGHRRSARGAEVVVGVLVDHGRDRIRELAAGLQTVGSAGPGQLDLPALLARAPAVVLVDELATANPPGAPNASRWEDVHDLLAAGSDVVTTLNVQEIASLVDAVTVITGRRPSVLVPDEVVRTADQVELVDMTPEALRRRLAHGNVYPPERVDAELASYFRVGTLSALRELALLWLADQVDEALGRYRAEHGIGGTWATRERVVVAVAGDSGGEVLLRRGARVAGRTSGGELLAVHVAAPDGLDAADPARLEELRRLAESLGGTFQRVVGSDVATALLEFARGANATQIVLGTRRAPARGLRAGHDVAAAVARASGDIDVHLVNRAEPLPATAAGRTRGGRGGGPVGSRRTWGWALAVAGPLALATLAALADDRSPPLSTVLLVYLTLTVAVALVGGLGPALASAVLGSLAVNYFFTPPLHTFTIAEPQNVFALLVFLVVAAAVSSVVHLAARRAAEAARGQAEAATLASLAGSALRGGDDSAALLERMRSTFAMTSAALHEREGAGSPWQRVVAAGAPPYPEPGSADVELVVADDLVAVMTGRPADAGDRRVMEAFAASLGTVLQRERLTARARQARRLEEGNAVRTALLAAVSHDLRTPLAGIKAAVSSLRLDDVEWTPQDQQALLATIEESADRLDHLVANLLDMSRLQTGAVDPHLRPVSLDEVVPPALAGVEHIELLSVQVPDTLPLVSADAGLLERVVANLVENATRHGAGSHVRLTGSVLGSRVQLRVVDRGPGVPDPDKERIFAPFQRSGDVPAGAGVGLGLAVARGFTEATGGQLWAEDTPGGGLTMVLSLPVAAVPAGPGVAGVPGVPGVPEAPVSGTVA